MKKNILLFIGLLTLPATYAQVENTYFNGIQKECPSAKIVEIKQKKSRIKFLPKYSSSNVNKSGTTDVYL